MHMLLTNDDGVTAPGLLALKHALEPLGQLTVIAPARNYSAAGHRKTMHKPLRLDPTQLADGSAAWSCSGAPSDCVALALLGFVKEKIDLVVSGINPHANLGQDITYSGTVTAALEAVIAGVAGIAVSTEVGHPADYATPAWVAARVVGAVSRAGCPAHTLLNVNIPSPTNGQWRVTRQGRRIYRDELVMRHDPRGRPYYWIGGEAPSAEVEEGTDGWALAQGYVSITPLNWDLTDHAALKTAGEWLVDLSGLR